MLEAIGNVVHILVRADHGDPVAGIELVVGTGDLEPLIAPDGADPHRPRQAHLLERNAQRGSAVLDLQFLNLEVAAGEVLHRNRTGVANAAGQFHGREVLQADQLVDVEVPRVVESAQIAKHRRVDPGHRAGGPHGLGQAGSHHVHFVVAGHGQAEIGGHHAGLEQHAGFAGRTGQGLEVEFFLDPLQVLGVTVHHGHIVAVAAEQLGNRTADRAGSQDNDIHGTCFAWIEIQDRPEF